MIISIIFYGHYYQKYFYNGKGSFKPKEKLTPQFIAALLLFMLFAIVYTNAKNENLIWQRIFATSGVAIGFREELFYRGIVQNVLQMKFNYKMALLLATLIFVLAHVQYIYHGQSRELMLITFAGLIFGSIYIHTGSIVFTAIIHGLYDAVLSINMVSFRLSNGVALPIMFLIMVIFLIIISKKLYSPQQADKTKNDDTDQDSFSLP